MRTTPTGYPETATPDSYRSVPSDDAFESRVAAFITHVLSNPGTGPYTELVRLEHGELPDEARIIPSIEKIEERRDCADFGLNGLVPLMYRHGDSDRLSAELRERIKEAILTFKYWPDEPGSDSMCTWTENHQIMFCTGAYLAGQLYPNEVFRNSGLTGEQMMKRFRPRIDRWLDLRFRSGFSEWLSHVYYNEDFPPLFNLIQYADDEELVNRASMVVDLMLYDVCLNQFRGTLGSTHGRSYERQKKDGGSEATGSVLKLLSGFNKYEAGNMSAVNLVMSDRYRVPDVFEAIARDTDRIEMINRQRVGIHVGEAKDWGLSFNDFEHGMAFLSLEAYLHPKTADLVFKMFDAFGWWKNKFFHPFSKHRSLILLGRKLGLMPFIAWIFRKDLGRNTREQANLITYRTPDYMLSTAQDYRKGYGGDQQHIWQATLGQKANVFTTHPAKKEADGEASSPNYWTGSGNLPRAVQVENVVVAMYHISTKPGLYLTHELTFTHAWFPVDEFDEVVERDGWIFARKGDGYLGLWSQNRYSWAEQDGMRTELVVEGKKNVYICELGRKETDGAFDQFADTLSAARIRISRGIVHYQSPKQGDIRLGWRGKPLHNGRPVETREFPRYGNPFGYAKFPADKVHIDHGDCFLDLDWIKGERRASGYLK